VNDGDGQRGARTLFFGLLLLAVLGGTGLFALARPLDEGNRFAPYGTYLLAGLLAGLVCRWLLRSAGWLGAGARGARVSTGLSLLVLTAVAGAGAAHQRCGHTSRTFTQRILFERGSSRPARLTGTVRLLRGAETRASEVHQSSEVAVANVPDAWSGRAVLVGLDTPPFVLADPERRSLAGPEPIRVTLVRGPASTYAGILSSRLKPWAAALIALEGTPCQVVSSPIGHFTFRECDEADRLVKPSVKVKLPHLSRFCPVSLELQPLPRRTDLRIEGDCSASSSRLGGDAGAACEFACGNGECVPARKVCDGRPDCSNRRDESRVICGSPDACCTATGGCPEETGEWCARSCCCCPSRAKCCPDPVSGCCDESTGLPVVPLRRSGQGDPGARRR
jgi:hypothetical protein